jgi:transcriptional antiterminator RfaH
MSEPSAWHLIYTKPRQELNATENLRRQGYTIYLPMLHSRKRKGSRTTETLVPLFPRYLFIHLTAGLDDWGPIRSTTGVSSLVRFGMEPVRVPDGLIDCIRARENEDGTHQETAPEFTHGDKVQITDGPFSGYEAIFQTQRSEERVLILLDVVGKATKTEVPLASVSKDGY